MLKKLTKVQHPHRRKTHFICSGHAEDQKYLHSPNSLRASLCANECIKSYCHAAYINMNGKDDEMGKFKVKISHHKFPQALFSIVAVHGFSCCKAVWQHAACSRRVIKAAKCTTLVFPIGPWISYSRTTPPMRKEETENRTF